MHACCTSPRPRMAPMCALPVLTKRCGTWLLYCQLRVLLRPASHASAKLTCVCVSVCVRHQVLERVRRAPQGRGGQEQVKGHVAWLQEDAEHPVNGRMLSPVYIVAAPPHGGSVLVHELVPLSCIGASHGVLLGPSLPPTLHSHASLPFLLIPSTKPTSRITLLGVEHEWCGAACVCQHTSVGAHTAPQQLHSTYY